jgi:hypothetical protein
MQNDVILVFFYIVLYVELHHLMIDWHMLMYSGVYLYSSTNVDVPFHCTMPLVLFSNFAVCGNSNVV